MSKSNYRNGSINHISNSGSRSNKVVKKGLKGKDCIYFNEQKKNCQLYKKLCTFCSDFSPKNYVPRKASRLSEYEEDYLVLPTQAGRHDSTREYVGLSKHIGTPVHVNYLKSNDGRRHKARCIYYCKATQKCEYFIDKCKGSAHCEKYEEKE